MIELKRSIKFNGKTGGANGNTTKPKRILHIRISVNGHDQETSS